LAQQSTKIITPFVFALTPNYKNTVIKEEENRIYLGITKLKDQKYTPILFHTIENPKLDVNLENLKSNLHYDFSKLFSYFPGAYNQLFILQRMIKII